MRHVNHLYPCWRQTEWLDFLPSSSNCVLPSVALGNMHILKQYFYIVEHTRKQRANFLFLISFIYLYRIHEYRSFVSNHSQQLTSFLTAVRLMWHRLLERCFVCNIFNNSCLLFCPEEPRSRPISTQSSAPFSSRFDKNSSSNMACKGGESRSVRTFTETSGSGASKVTKTVVEETITKADGSKCTNRKETITTGDSGSAPCDMKSIGHHDGKDKDKKGGAFGVRISKLTLV